MVAALPWHRQPWLRWVAVPAAAALIVVAGLEFDRPPAWRVAALEGGGTALVDGARVPLTARDLEASLAAGVRLRLPATGSVTLASRGRMLLELTPGTEMTLPASPGRWLKRSSVVALASGELHATTGPAFRGARLAIETAEARLEVTGTTFAVLCLKEGTCVCVHEGVVRVGARGGAMAPVTAGRRREVFNDGRPLLDDAMLAHKHANLERLAALRDSLLR